ncbi:MAG: HAD-IA family hydrolase [Opitutales bacterium]|nr:HAD-IA family hydrolase [Opitutales bacterium]
MVRVVGIDFDGTIADTLPLCIEAFRLALAPVCGRMLSDEEITEGFGMDEEGIARRLAPNRWREVVDGYLRHYEILHPQYSGVIDGMEDVLKTVKNFGAKLVLITGKAKASADISLKKFGIIKYFDAFEFGSPVKNRKAEAIAAALARYKISPAEMVYIGDVPSDVEAARANRVRCLSAAYAKTAQAELLELSNPGNVFYGVGGLKAELVKILKPRA